MGKMTIITPSYRVDNLKKIYDTMNFDYIDEWIIVYDGNRLNDNPYLFKSNEKVSEYLHKGDGFEGNPQRNYGLIHIKNEDTYLYFLDDDNIIHSELYKLLDFIEPTKFYTFDQNNIRYGILHGNDVRVCGIDTAMFICHYSLVKGIFWGNHTKWADGVYISECYQKNKENHIYINHVMSYWNYLR